ncbi:MAG: signal recognition particle protein, partial [Devosia sp.]
DMMKKVGKGGVGALSGMFGGKMGQMMPGLGGLDPSKMDPAQLDAMARQMGLDPAAMQQASGAAAPKQLSDKLPDDVGALLKSAGAPRFPGLPGLGGGFVPKKK